MGRKNFKKGQGGSFTKLDEWFMSSEAWGSLKPAPRALYLELKRLYNGKNNGRIFLSQRDASKKLNISVDIAIKKPNYAKSSTLHYSFIDSFFNFYLLFSKKFF